MSSLNSYNCGAYFCQTTTTLKMIQLESQLNILTFMHETFSSEATYNAFKRSVCVFSENQTYNFG